MNESIFAPYSAIDFAEVNARARRYASLIETRFDRLAQVLSTYETWDVIEDEVGRAVDLLRSLEENADYFRLRVNEVASFLPRNQVLYAFTCFVVVPSFMAAEVSFRVPHSMKRFYPHLLEILEVAKFFPNVRVSHESRTGFLRERSALLVDPITNDAMPRTDVVIFTGTPTHARQVRAVFDPRTLVIANGSGHNPVVISDDADVDKAVDAVLALQLYNQGQDCAAPNAVLVHEGVYEDVLRRLRAELAKVAIGPYSDRNVRIGPITDTTDLVRIQQVLVRNAEWIDPTTPGVIRTHESVVEPTIVAKPLAAGGSYEETFAPVIFLQSYRRDDELARYFEDTRYSPNAMYVTVFGRSDYVEGLSNRRIDGKVLHPPETVLRENHLHMPGVERGTQPYGGNGADASSLTINGSMIAKATLPQRDIYEQVIAPLVDSCAVQQRLAQLRTCSRVDAKPVERLVKLTTEQLRLEPARSEWSALYVDRRALAPRKGAAFVEVPERHAHRLLNLPNVAVLTQLTSADLQRLKDVSDLVAKNSQLDGEEFADRLYAIAGSGAAADETKMRQKAFFELVYKLLFGRPSGPRLHSFLREADWHQVSRLLGV